MKSTKKLMIIILIFIILIMTFLIIIYINIKKKSENINNNGIIADLDVDFERLKNENQIKEVTSYPIFSTVNKCITTYLNTININNYMYFKKTENGNYEKAVTQQEINAETLKLLDKDFIDENGLTSENLDKNIDFLGAEVYFIPVEMQIIQTRSMDKVAVRGYLTSVDIQPVKEVYYVVNMDVNHYTFSIQPLANFNNTEKLLTTVDFNIEENDMNAYEDIVLDNEELSEEHIEIFTKLSIAYPEISYDYLDEEYKQKRFPTLEEYKQYIINNKDRLRSTELYKYLVTYENEYTQFACIDKNGYNFVFKDSGVMNYKVILDSYTVEVKELTGTYSSLSNKGKVSMNVATFFEMINTGDYKAEYSVIVDEFKNTNFPTLASFENYVKTNFFKYNNIVYGAYSDQISGIYTYEIQLQDQTKKDADAKNINIVMQLLENNEYKLSFSQITQ